jgi:FAD/FMN-containing dehydrogenase
MVHLIDALNDKLAGAAFAAGDEGWDEARRAWNLGVDQRPAMVVEAESAADVQAVVELARRERLRLAPQSTGHGAAPLEPLDGTILLKTSRMRAVAVDPARRVARVEAGAVARDVAAAASGSGLAAVGGYAPGVGVAGFTLSGGIGWLGRRHGLASNNVRAIELVTADGAHRRVDHQSDSDLFWALRGGGGNFGVVTAFEIDVHPVPELAHARLVWPAAHLHEVLERYAAWTRDLPEATSSVLRFFDAPGNPVVTVVVVHLGPVPDAERLVHPLRSSTDLVTNTLEPGSADDLITVAGDPEDPAPALGQGALVRDLEPDLVDLLAGRIERGEHKPLMGLELRQLGGALGRAQEGHGALGRLEGRFSLFAGGPAPPPVRDAAKTALRSFHEDLRPWTTGALLNFSNLRTDPAGAFDAVTWSRLRRMRHAVDPDGVLVANHPITLES